MCDLPRMSLMGRSGRYARTSALWDAQPLTIAIELISNDCPIQAGMSSNRDRSPVGGARAMGRLPCMSIVPRPLGDEWVVGVAGWVCWGTHKVDVQNGLNGMYGGSMGHK